MTTYSLNGHTLIGVTDIPKEAKGFLVDVTVLGSLLYILMDNPPESDYYVKLPEGNWSIIGSGLAGEITHEDWEPLVEWFEIKEQRGYRNYMSEYLSFPFNPKESGESWLLANGLEKNCTVLLKLK